MSYLDSSNYELPYASKRETSREAAEQARKFVGRQGLTVLAWFVSRGVRYPAWCMSGVSRMLREWFCQPVQWMDDEAPIDVWSFRARERLAVHEARTAAEFLSGVVRASEREKNTRERRLQQWRLQARKAKVA